MFISQNPQLVPNGSLTATPGGGQANALQLVFGVNVVTVVGSVADSVKLPAATGSGRICVVSNVSLNVANTYPQLGEQIGSNAIDSPQNIATNRSHWFIDQARGQWSSPLIT